MTQTADSLRAQATNKAAYEDLHTYVAGGVSSNMRARGIVEPVVVESASGCRVRDIEGNELIDVNMGYGPHIFGYADRDVTDRVAELLGRGHMTGLPHRLDREAAALITELVPGIDQVRFANSGTEALMSAVRLARVVSGKTLLLTFESHYHGWGETLLRTPRTDGYRPRPGAPGMIPEATAHTIQIPWNDTEALEKVFAEYGDRLGGAICEPVHGNAGVVPPEPGFLELLRERTAEQGTVLIFDEVITGFRVARGGAQELFGVVPDLTVISKAMGGGLPVAAFGGPREMMRPLAEYEAFHAGVYSGNHASLCAVAASLDKIRSSAALYTELEGLGSHAENRIREAFASAARPVHVERVGSMMSVALLDAGGEVDHSGHRRLQSACQRRGVYFHPVPKEPWFLSTAHTTADLDTVAETMRECLTEHDVEEQVR